MTNTNSLFSVSRKVVLSQGYESLRDFIFYICTLIRIMASLKIPMNNIYLIVSK